VTAAPGAGRPAGVAVVTSDVGNPPAPVARAGLAGVVHRLAEAAVEHSGPFELDTFSAAWAEERERQFAEELPGFREVDLRVRLVRVLARLRGMPVPVPSQRWDDAPAAGYCEPAELDHAIDAYSRAFVEAMPPPPDVGPLLERLAGRHRLAVLSNWPLAATIDRYVEAAGWSRWLDAVIVSQRVGAIKPHPSIFAATLEALGSPSAAAAVHVGDDWAADVVGAKRAGGRAILVTSRPPDSPLPASEPDGSVEPDAVVATLADLEVHL
jgi:putative hydrolase of the HAD superfamily